MNAQVVQIYRTILLQYNIDFDWERSCMDTIVISEKDLVKKYLNSLKPEVFKTEVLRECPDDLEEAKMYAGHSAISCFLPRQVRFPTQLVW